MQDCPLQLNFIDLACHRFLCDLKKLAKSFYWSLHLESRAVLNHRMPQPFFRINHQIPQWSQIIFISQLFRVFSFVCQMGGSFTFGNNSLHDIMAGMPNQSQKSELKFLITQLYRISQLLYEFCKAPLESAVSDSCLACLPTPGPSVVPVNWLAVPGRSKKWGRGVLSVGPLPQTPAGFPWQLLVMSLIFCLPAGCKGGTSFGWWVARSKRLVWKVVWGLLGEVCSRISWGHNQSMYKLRSWHLMETSCTQTGLKIITVSKICVHYKQIEKPLSLSNCV